MSGVASPKGDVCLCKILLYIWQYTKDLRGSIADPTSVQGGRVLSKAITAVATGLGDLKHLEILPRMCSRDLVTRVELETRSTYSSLYGTARDLTKPHTPCLNARLEYMCKILLVARMRLSP